MGEIDRISSAIILIFLHYFDEIPSLMVASGGIILWQA